jgi:hypothetical protein
VNEAKIGSKGWNEGWKADGVNCRMLKDERVKQDERQTVFDIKGQTEKLG